LCGLVTGGGGAPRNFHQQRRRGFMTGGVGGVRPEERALKHAAHSLDRRFFLV